MTEPNLVRDNPLAFVVLCRVAVPVETPLSAGDIARQLHGLVAHALSAPRWRERVDEVLAELESEGLVAGRRATDAGRALVLAGLGAADVPTWEVLKRTYLSALALGLDPRDAAVRRRLGDADGLRASVVRAAFGLTAHELPTRRQAMDELVWKTIGVDTDRPLSAGAVRAHFLGEVLGASSRRDADGLFDLLAARAVSSPRPDAGSLRDALVGRWLGDLSAGERAQGGEPLPPAPSSPEASASALRAATSTGPAPAPEADPDSAGALRSFCQAARRAAEAVGPDGRFGESKVYIASVWWAMGGSSESRRAFDDFKRRLCLGHVAGDIRLLPADAVTAAKSPLARESEVRYLDDCFHFVDLHGP